MSDGLTHDRVGFALIPAAVVAAGYAGQWLHNPHTIWIGAISYTIGISHLSPDLDTPSLPFYRWGFLKCIWIPYQQTQPHRGFSHDVVIGTLSRVFYFSIPVLMLVGLYIFTTGKSFSVATNWQDLATILIALEASAWVHLGLDGILVERLFFGRQ